MPIKCQQMIQLIEELAPKKLAENWDNVGLQIGDPSMIINNVMITLDVTLEVVKEAIEKNIDMIISHHPLIFNPLKNLRFDHYQGKIIRTLIKNNIALYVAHTNLDIANGGLNDILAQTIGLNDIRILSDSYSEKLYKLVVFVPNEQVEEIKEELGRQGAGWIGNYSHCSYTLKGTGNFKPLEGSNPYIGNIGSVEKVNESRIETIVTQKNLSRTVKAMLRVHPYEEVAYDIYPLENKGTSFGLGRIGTLSNILKVDEFVKHIKKVLAIKSIRVAGPKPEKIKKVAVCTGAGADLMTIVKYSGADVFITGDIKYHDAQRASTLGVFVIDAGHFATEEIVIEGLYEYFNRNLIIHKNNVVIHKSKNNFDFIKEL